MITFFVFLAAGNESCPQPQTSEHLAAIEIMKLKHILILQNKIDLVKESQAKEQYEQILAFVQGESVDLHFINLHSKTPFFFCTSFFILDLMEFVQSQAAAAATVKDVLLQLSCFYCRYRCRRGSHHSHLGAAQVQH